MFSILSLRAPNKVFIAIVLGALSGVLYSFLIPLLTSSLQPVDSRFDMAPSAPCYIGNFEIANAPAALLFCLACILIVACRSISQVTLTRVAMTSASDLRVQLYRRIVGAPVSILEHIGSARLVTTIVTDVPRIVLGAHVIPELLVSFVTLLGMLGFLAYLNLDVFWFVLKCIFFGIITYEIPVLLGKRFAVRAGNSSEALQKSIDGLIRGIKELKLNDAKRRAFFEADLMANENLLLDAQKSHNTIMRVATNYGDMVCFFGIGAIAFVFVNYHAIRSQELIAVIMVLLYITGPISVVLNMAPQLAIANVSFARVSALLSELPDEEFAPPRAAKDWERLHLHQVTYQHEATGESPGFKVGPFDLEFHKGEITFIVGGNGSGKSTLCKLLTLHYPASSGSIYFDGHVVDGSTINTFRQDIVSIYSDYHLFDRIHGSDVEQSEVERYLSLLKLDKKVTYEDGKFSSLLLSDGQRRRMALLIAFLEDKQIYLFDEWAADQDPNFKDAFYHEILPSLRSKGKVVIAITHDDRYFGVADKVVTMTDGRVTSITHASATSASLDESDERLVRLT